MSETQNQLLHDGPYIFINKDIAHIYTIAGYPLADEPQFREEEIPLYRLADHIFTTTIDSRKDGIAIPEFSFKLRPVITAESTPAVYSQPGKLLVTSDIEGNFYALSNILLVNKVINTDGDWIFGNNHLLINGDLIDRSDNVLPCLWLIYKLEAQAKDAGGVVHYILGNHELMNFQADFRYLHPKYSSPGRMLHLYTGLFDHSSVLGNWISSKNAIEKIGDYLFVHAGISKMLIHELLTMEEINTIIQNNLRKSANATGRLESLVMGNNGPLWYRGMVIREYERNDFRENDVHEILSYFNASTIVVGHTMVPSFKKLYNGKLIAIDIELPGEDDEVEEVDGSRLQALLIEDGKEFIVNDKGEKIPFNVYA